MGDRAVISIRKFWTAQTHQAADPRVIFWYGLSLVFAAYYGYLVLQSSFGATYVVQDDARQHVFWMQRLIDPALLPDDFMADYFTYQATPGYKLLYQGAAALGIHPFTLNKVLPPMLGVLGTHYCFRLSLQLLPVPATAFTSTLLLNQTLWMRDDLVSGTPRAFISVLLLAFLVFVNGRMITPALVALTLQVLFYPQGALLAAGILVLRLVTVDRGHFRLSRSPHTYLLSGFGLIIVIALLAPCLVDSSPFGPLITPAAARQLPEFWPGGRNAYFTDNPILFWFGDRSGLLPTPMLTPPTIAFSLFFPWLWWRSPHRWLPLIKARMAILQQLVLASLGLYFAAHLLLYQLHLPSRYMHHSLRIVFALTASFTMGLFLDYLMQLMARPAATVVAIAQRGVAITAFCGVMIGLFGYSGLTQSFPFTNNRYGRLPDLYQFLQATPLDTTVASLTKETSNLHVFTQRSPLISPELGLAYHTGYYQTFRQRTVDLIEAQYSPDLQTLQAFIQQYGIDYWLIDDQSFSLDRLTQDNWFNQYQPAAQEAITNLTTFGDTLALIQAKPQCTVIETTPQSLSEIAPLGSDEAQAYWLLDANCLRDLS